jgi:DNA-binding MarR family transcriptional regulator
MAPAKKPRNATEGPPYVGALLRLSLMRTGEHMYRAVRAHGFDDLQMAHFSVFSYPPPDGVRLSVLAGQARMSPQATNYMVGQLEELGYLERRAKAGSERRLIYMTARGKRLIPVIHEALLSLQEQWAREVGRERFADFMDLLRHFSTQQPPTSTR